MSQLSKSLEKRIQELTASIEAQKTELAAYERVLHMEVSKGTVPVESSEANEAPLEASHNIKKARKKRATKKGAKKTGARKAVAVESAPEASAAVPFTGNKTSLVAEIVKSYGSAGATPKEVDAYFTARNVERSKNLIYNTLSYLVAQKKLKRRDGKYFTTGRGSKVAKKSAAATKKAPTKRRLSPEGLKRIKEALKKRWAAKKAEAAEADNTK